MLPQVFDSFVQGTQAAARKQGGLGLGLAIARALVSLHGGRISAHSDGKGRGSSFRITPPLLAAGSSDAALPAPSARCAVAARVLVIDDAEDVRATMCEILAGQGYEVRNAADGVQGLEAARAFVPEVTLCDIGMPGLDGYQVARQWRRDPVLRASGLIAITGYGRAQDQALAREAGFDRHLTKPVSAETLLDLVAALVQAGRQRRAVAETARA